MADKEEQDSGVRRHLSRGLQVSLVWEGALVGLAGGGIVTLYRLALTFAERLLRQTLALSGGHILLIIGWFVGLAVICLLVCKLMTFEPFTQGSGIPQTDAEVMGRIDMPWYRVMIAKFAEGVLCTFGGLSLGREGPSVQLGGMAGKAVSKTLKRGRGEERLLVTCGAAAGMSAAFNAPLTGVLFALEEIHKEFNGPLIVSVMASSIASDFLVSQVLGVEPVLSFIFTKDLPHSYYGFVVLMGVFCGLLGAAHNLGMFACQERLYSKIKKHLPYARLAVAFALAGILAFLAPDLLCGGDAIVQLINQPGLLPISTIAALLIGKYLFTTASFASGAPGGTLFPLCVLGILSGALYGCVLSQTVGLEQAYITNFIVLGIAGLFASVVRAPVTAVVLAFELTGSLDALLSVSLVSIISYVIANLTGVDPFYEHLLSGLLGVSSDNPDVSGLSGEKILHEYTIGAGSRAEGQLISDLNWPKGVRVITLDRLGHELVPTGSTKLEAFDELLVIMDQAHEDEDVAWMTGLCNSALATNRTPRSTLGRYSRH